MNNYLNIIIIVVGADGCGDGGVIVFDRVVIIIIIIIEFWRNT